MYKIPQLGVTHCGRWLALPSLRILPCLFHRRCYSKNVERPVKTGLFAHEIDPKGRCTEKTFTKSEIIVEMGARNRDLRSIDVSYPLQITSVLVRKKSLIVYMAGIRAIIQHNRLLLFGSNIGDDVDYISTTIQKSTEIHEYGQPPLPFELRALEAILMRVAESLQIKLEGFDERVGKIEPYKVNPERRYESLELYQTKLDLAQFGGEVRKVRESLEDLLKSDEDMSAMSLTAGEETGLPQKKSDHEEVEMLLENYFLQVEQVEGKIKLLKDSIQIIEASVEQGLYYMRHTIMKNNLTVSICAFSATVISAIFGMFGMNLLNGLEHDPLAFTYVILVALSTSPISFLILRSIFFVNGRNGPKNSLFIKCKNFFKKSKSNKG